jgi:hypothetical protein
MIVTVYCFLMKACFSFLTFRLDQVKLTALELNS